MLFLIASVFQFPALQNMKNSPAFEITWLHSLYCMFVTQQAESETWGISMFFYNYENIYAFTLYILWHKQKQEEYPCIWPQGSFSLDTTHILLIFNSNLIPEYILVNISSYLIPSYFSTQIQIDSSLHLQNTLLKTELGEKKCFHFSPHSISVNPPIAGLPSIIQEAN